MQHIQASAASQVAVPSLDVNQAIQMAQNQRHGERAAGSNEEQASSSTANQSNGQIGRSVYVDYTDGIDYTNASSDASEGQDEPLDPAVSNRPLGTLTLTQCRVPSWYQSSGEQHRLRMKLLFDEYQEIVKIAFGNTVVTRASYVNRPEILNPLKIHTFALLWNTDIIRRLTPFKFWSPLYWETLRDMLIDRASSLRLQGLANVMPWQRTLCSIARGMQTHLDQDRLRLQIEQLSSAMVKAAWHERADIVARYERGRGGVPTVRRDTPMAAQAPQGVDGGDNGAVPGIQDDGDVSQAPPRTAVTVPADTRHASDSTTQSGMPRGAPADNRAQGEV